MAVARGAANGRGADIVIDALKQMDADALAGKRSALMQAARGGRSRPFFFAPSLLAPGKFSLLGCASLMYASRSNEAAEAHSSLPSEAGFGSYSLRQPGTARCSWQTRASTVAGVVASSRGMAWEGSAQRMLFTHAAPGSSPVA